MVLKQKVWESEKYYKRAREGSTDLKHPGMKLLLDLAKNKRNIFKVVVITKLR